MSKNVVLPVLIEDLIQKVSDKKTPIEKRQHYANNIRNIKNALEQTLVKFDKEYKEYFSK